MACGTPPDPAGPRAQSARSVCRCQSPLPGAVGPPILTSPSTTSRLAGEEGGCEATRLSAGNSLRARTSISKSHIALRHVPLVAPLPPYAVLPYSAWQGCCCNYGTLWVPATYGYGATQKDSRLAAVVVVVVVCPAAAMQQAGMRQGLGDATLPWVGPGPPPEAGLLPRQRAAPPPTSPRLAILSIFEYFLKVKSFWHFYCKFSLKQLNCISIV